ncbi:regulator of G-protein signaling loco [Lutzomyia longipalpis]|uniref:regulator of G-protein signaling loco n=1 Tax=Lutzomyia longipalpis TaxID=7200 RepID=UPI0024838900|nr:regulator of G-protein signaling loco [Lutzomyia longipalpis]
MHRRRKKRPNYGTRTVEVCRGINGFGFTISGQQPCILSCIVNNSPADLAGLRAGDFLINVNGLNVSKLPHEAVVQLIGNSSGSIRMTIAENYFSDSSDEDPINTHTNVQRVRPKYQNKIKANRGLMRRTMEDRNSPSTILSDFALHNLALRQIRENETLLPTSPTGHDIILSPTASDNKDVRNVSAMVRASNKAREEARAKALAPKMNRLREYRVIVGYLGTVEVPRQISMTGSKLQTVRGCIRKLRHEKRGFTTVLMTILPNCMTLKNCGDILLATFPAGTINYVSSGSQSDNRFFGIITSGLYSDGLMCDPTEVILRHTPSHSCHVFAIDTRITDHSWHFEKVNQFKITCSRDPLTNTCQEVPSTSEYVVNLIRSMYTLKSSGSRQEAGMPFRSKPPLGRGLHMPRSIEHRLNPRALDDHDFMANSPQPSNHSEITTTSSNSDSGIGFHNDCPNISDRVLVVDFPGIQNHKLIPSFRPNPIGSSDTSLRSCGLSSAQQEVESLGHNSSIVESIEGKLKPQHSKSKSADNTPRPSTSSDTDPRLTVRAMPDPKILSGMSRDDSTGYETVFPNLPLKYWLSGKAIDDDGNLVQERPVDVPTSYGDTANRPFSCDITELEQKRKNFLQMARSCNDIILSFEKEFDRKVNLTKNRPSIQMSMDDVSVREIESKSPKVPDHDHVFLPPKPVKKPRKMHEGRKSSNMNKIMSYKLSPKVFGLSRPMSASLENIARTFAKKNSSDTKETSSSIYGSLKDLQNIDLSPRQNLLDSNAYSEPDLRSNDDARALPTNSGNSPFKRWGQSSFRSRSNEQRNLLPRRPSSLAASESDVYTKSINGDIATGRIEGEFSDAGNGTCGGVSGWSNSFERLLEDTAGLHAFAEFLKKEFSAENIYFWTACERYRQIEDQHERAKEAQEIFAKHLASTAQEPVNVDCQVRNTAEENLQSASIDLFEAAQKQIFNLMKFDSYARFIRSDLFKSCLEAESKCKPLPYPGDQLDAGLRTGPVVPTPSKLKKSLSNAEDRRRKSLLPWHRKTRCKSKDRDEANRHLSGGSKSGGSSLRVPLMNSNSDLHSSRSSLSSFDAAITKLNTNNDSEEGKSTLCRVILPDAATTIVQTRSGETVRELVDRLLEKRGLTYNCYEAFLAGFSKPLDLEELSRNVAGKEIQIEQRVVFKLDLPNRKVISVKSKPCKFLEDVLRPILHKYNYRLEMIQAFGKESPDAINMKIAVTTIDGQRLQIAIKGADGGSNVKQMSKLVTTASIDGGGNCDVAQLKNTPVMQQQQQHPCMTGNFNQSTLDEITNKVFNELLQGKVETMAGTAGAAGLENPLSRATVDQLSMKSEEWGSETSSGIFTRARRHELLLKHRGRKMPQSQKNSQTESEDNADGTKKPLIAKWKSGAKLQVTTRSSPGGDDLLEGLKRAQRSRLEDQRGTEINFELPEFLRNKENMNNNKSRRESRYDDGGSEVDGIQRRDSNDRVSGFPPRPQPAPRLSIINNNNHANCGLSPRTPPPSTSLVGNNNEMATSGGGNYTNSAAIERSLLQLLESSPPQPSGRSDSEKFDNSPYLTPSRTGFTDPELFYGRHSGDRNAFRHGDLLNSSFSSTTTNNSTHYFEEMGGGFGGAEMDVQTGGGARGPPPLPPKPKVVPMKPSNWSQSTQRQKQSKMSPTSGIEDVFKMPVEMPRMSENTRKQKNAYFDQPSSSFV